MSLFVANEKILTIDGLDINFIYATDVETSVEFMLYFPQLKACCRRIPDENFSTGGMFSNGTWLKSFSAANIKKIGNNTFSYCQNLETVSFPAATTIGKAAFMFCSHLETASFPKATETGSFSFHNCSGLSSVHFPVLETIGVDAFSFCQNLQTISFPKVATVGDFAFNPCRNLSEITFPVVTEISDFAFSNDENLIEASFGDGFDALATINFPNPVLESFRINGMTENSLLTIINMTGKVVLQKTVHDVHSTKTGRDDWFLTFDYIYGGTEDVLHTLKIAPADVVRLNNVVKHISIDYQ